MAGDPYDFDHLPPLLPLGNPTSAPVYTGHSEYHTSQFDREVPAATVVMRSSGSVQDMAVALAEERMNTSEALDVHYMSGTTILMHSPCDLDDNFYVTLTEEGPMLYRAVQRSLRFQSKEKSARMSLLLVNKCPHHAYRDELRDMIIGRDHSVFKVQPTSLTCVERLVTPPPVSHTRESSLQHYFAYVSERAAEHYAAETAHREDLRAAARRQAAQRGHPPSCLNDEGDILGSCSTSQSYEAAAASEAAEERLGVRPLRVGVIQSTRSERRIINLDSLVGTIQRSLAVFTLPNQPRARTSKAKSEIVRKGRVETLYLDTMELWEQIRCIQDIDVLIGVTGSDLSTLAFLKPGSMVIELASHTYETDLVLNIMEQAHGSSLRGQVLHRKAYVKAIASAAFDAAYSAVRLDALTQEQFNSFLLTKEHGFRKDFHAIVNTTGVADLLSAELIHRLQI